MATLTKMAVSNPHTQYSIWQWNCRSYRRKRSVLEQFLSTLKETDTPDIIALQESGGQAKQVGYASFMAAQAPDSREVFTILVKRNIPVIQHPSLSDTVPHIILEILSSFRRTSTSMFLVNVYSSPRQPHRFHKLLSYVKKLARISPLLVVQDFNAPSPAWGYIHDTRKGRMLWQDAHNLGYNLITETAYPTWLGDSVTRDTTLDLTFTANITHAEWSNHHEHLGSEPAFGDWDVFRELRATASSESATSIDQRTASLLRDVKRATKTPPEDAVGDTVDTKLLHMWEALAGLRKRYNFNKLNRSLR
ncbi:hypothetical protein HPB51_024308 [Rhipicephalus microplus]|uniref:Endonuclease/exonuclease/phosphatase domain-containing protein n=1 Tax=Rhipicephalus microplus TaxID=6941 RepID=A0A9J6DX41_RHIMP|nr:hypothetical protein HPB51_024308 [Rhipicephalus microplus]